MMAARGKVFSGQAVKEAGRFATGLADQTYATQASVLGDNDNRAINKFTTNYGMARDKFQTNISPLFAMMQTGASASAQTAQLGAQAATTGGQFMSNAGVQQATGTFQAGQAYAGALNQGMNNLLKIAGYSR